MEAASPLPGSHFQAFTPSLCAKPEVRLEA